MLAESSIKFHPVTNPQDTSANDFEDISFLHQISDIFLSFLHPPH